MKYITLWHLEKYFYSGFGDPLFEQDQKKGKKIHREFIKKYIPTFHTFTTSKQIVEFYREYSYLISLLEKPLYYAYYRTMQNINDKEAHAKYVEINNQYEQYIKSLDFIQDGWKQIGKENLEIFLTDPILDPYRNDMVSIIEHLPHIGLQKTKSMKSMNIENIRIEYQKIQNIYISDEEKKEQISHLYSQLCSLWYDQMIEGNYGNNPMALRNRQEQLPDDFVVFFISRIQDFIPQYHNFLSKRETTEKLKKSYTIEKTIDTYIQTFSEIFPNKKKDIQDVFVSGRSDMIPSFQKFPGAFSSYRHGEPAFLLLHFREDISSVFTLAHEMGHILHGTFSQQQKAPVYHSPFSLAETASILSELLYFDANFATNEEAKSYLLNSLYTSIFYQLQITLFEQESHKNHNSEKYDYSYLWNTLSKKVSGPSKKNDSWMQIAHIFHSPFYCYSYIFGTISALSIFLRYKSGELGLQDLELLYSSGGSVRPLDLLLQFGIDLQDANIYDEIFTFLRS